MQQCSFKKIPLLDVFYLFFPLLYFVIFLQNSQLGQLYSGSMDMVLYFIGATLGGSIQVIYNLFQCIHQMNKRKSNIPLTISPYEKIRKKKLKESIITCCFVFALTVSNILGLYLYNIVGNLYESKKANELFEIIIQFAFFIFCSRAILDTRLKKHEYYSIGLILIGLVGLSYNTIILSQWLETISFFLLIDIIQAILYSYSKLVMELKYIQPLFLSFCYGISGLFIIALVYCVCRWFQISHWMLLNLINVPSNFKAIFANWRNIGLLFSQIVIYSIIHIQIFLIIYYKNPVTLTILVNGVYAFIQIYSVSYSFDSIWVLVLLLVSCNCYIFGLMLYMEILIINWCAGDTNKEIIGRAKDEMKGLFSVSASEIIIWK